MAGSLYDRLQNPSIRANLSPYIEHVTQTANALGVDPDFVTASIVAESAGLPNAVGDGGKAVGVYQVHTPYLRDWGMAQDVRRDPVSATTAIMPSFKRLVDTAGGDWALARVMYMRNPNGKGPTVTALRQGVPPEQVLAKDPIALDQYRQFKALQARQRPPAAAPDTAPYQAQPSGPTRRAAPTAQEQVFPLPPVAPVQTVRAQAPQMVDPRVYLRALGIDLGI